MRSLSAVDCRRVVELVADTLRCASSGFPDETVTGLLRDVFQTEFAGAAQIDFRGTASHHWANSPHQIWDSRDDFHSYVVRHPLALAYRNTGELVPLRLSDVTPARTPPPALGATSLPRLLTIPLDLTPARVCSIALLRGGRDFTSRDLQMAAQLQPVLSGIYSLRDRLAGPTPGRAGQDTGITLTARELAVLNLMAEGLIASAIARRLSISPRTVSKHVEHIYEKLGTHDRTTTALRARALGFLADKH